MEAPPRSERATLPRELSEFLIELSIALHRHSMYPVGHPALIPAIESVIRRAEKLLDDRPEIAFGVARRQLIIDGVTTDPDQPVLRRLAEVLHRHHIGAVTFLRGMETYELGDALHALAVEADREGPLGLKPNAGNWPHVRLHPLTFDGLTLADTPGGTIDSEQTPSGPGLWIGLSRAALASDGSENASVPSEPSAIAKAIEQNAGRADAYDRVIVGYLLQIARELKTASGESAEELKRRTSQLIATLNPGTLRRLVSMDGNKNQRNQFVLDATHVMAVDAVLEIVKASAEASGQTISHGLVRMLTKLAAHAERGSDRTRPRADVELREQVDRLLQDWRLEDPNPEAYGRVLQQLSVSTTPEASPLMQAVAAEPEPLRLVQMALEANAFGPLAERAIDEAISAGQLSGLLELIASPPEGGQAGAELLLTRLTRPESLRGLFAGDRIDLASLNHLLPRLPLEAYDPLLEAVGSSPNRMVRRRLLDLLSRTAVDITPLIVTRLTDERWYVQRNMLTLLARRGTVPQSLSVVPWTHHPDSRVRAEAIRLQLTMPHERHLGIEAALNDRDPRIVHLGLTAIQECPSHLIERVIDLALAPDLGDESRLLAVNAIARERREDVLEALLQLSIAGRSWFGRIRLPPKSAELLAVIRALAAIWSDDRRAAGVLAAAARSSDPEIRQALSAEIP